MTIEPVHRCVATKGADEHKEGCAWLMEVRQEIVGTAESVSRRDEEFCDALPWGDISLS